MRLRIEGRKRVFSRESVITSRVQKLKFTCLMTRESNVTMEILSLKKLIHIPHQLSSLKVLVSDGNFYMECTKTDFPHAVRLSATTEHGTEYSKMFLDFNTVSARPSCDVL